MDVRLRPLGPTTGSLVVARAFLRVELGPGLLREVRGQLVSDCLDGNLEIVWVISDRVYPVCREIRRVRGGRYGSIYQNRDYSYGR